MQALHRFFHEMQGAAAETFEVLPIQLLFLMLPSVVGKRVVIAFAASARHQK